MIRARSAFTAALMGAAAANVIAVAVVFIPAAIWGYAPPQIGHPNGGGQVGPMLYGFEAGRAAVEILLIVYIMTIGLAPLGISLVGAVVALLIRRFRAWRSTASAPQQLS